MKRTNKLSFKKENVRILSGSDLAAVQGGTVRYVGAAVSGNQCNQNNNAGAATSGTITSERISAEYGGGG